VEEKIESPISDEVDLVSKETLVLKKKIKSVSSFPLSPSHKEQPHLVQY
jgi:hypothetical protein